MYSILGMVGFEEVMVYLYDGILRETFPMLNTCTHILSPRSKHSKQAKNGNCEARHVDSHLCWRQFKRISVLNSSFTRTDSLYGEPGMFYKDSVRLSIVI